MIWTKVRNVFTSMVDNNWEPDVRPNSLPEPTDARPGSAEKLAILKQRIDSGQELWHPNDFNCLADPMNASRHAIDRVEQAEQWRRLRGASGPCDGEDGEMI